jgi:hypothetical protein
MIRIRNSPLFFFIAVTLGCGQIERETLLSGRFGNADASAPVLASPAQNARISAQNGAKAQVLFSWETKTGVTGYDLEVSEKSDFSTQVAGSPVAVRAMNGLVASEYSFAVSDSRTLHWRVRNTLSPSGVYSEVRVVHVSDAIYVFCDGSEADCENTGAWGTKNMPYRNIAGALIVAAANGLDVRIAARGNNAHYNEAFSLLPGVSLRGGYDAVNWQHTPQSHATEIANSADTVLSLRSGLTLPTQEHTMTGLTIRSLATSGTNRVIYIEGSNRLLIENNHILAGSGTVSRGIELAYHASPVIRNNIIHGGNGTDAMAVYAHNSSPLLQNNNIFAGGYSTRFAFAARALAASPIFLANRMSSIAAHNVTFLQAGLEIVNDSQYTAVIAGNEILAGGRVGSPGTSESLGIRVVGSASGAPGVFAGQNFIAGGQATSATAIYVDNGAGPRIINNTALSGIGSSHSRGAIIGSGGGSNQGRLQGNMFITQGGSVRHGVFEGNALGDPLHFGKNAILDAGAGGTFFVYRDENATDYAYICSDGKPGGTNGCAVGVNIQAGFGNSIQSSYIEPSSAAAFFLQPAVITFAQDGPDAGSDYNGDNLTIELGSETICNLFSIGNYFELFLDRTPRQITNRSCSASTSFITISPSHLMPKAEGLPITFWGTENAQFERKYALKTSAISLNAGYICPGDMISLSHSWGPGSNQADCDSRFPHSNATYATGVCQSTYLYPAIQIDPNGTGSGPFNIPVSGNGLCEPGETCLYNPNIGAYPGHGNLVASGCDLSSVAGGIFTTVNLLKYESNGY